jgi:uncharacterized protein YqeY
VNIRQELKDLTLKLRKERSPLASVMVFHLSELDAIGKNNGNRETTETEAVQYVKKTVQKLKENPAAQSAEILMLEELLPQMATEEELRAFLATLPDLTNKGAVMGAVKGKFGVLADMKLVAKML